MVRNSTCIWGCGSRSEVASQVLPTYLYLTDPWIHGSELRNQAVMSQCSMLLHEYGSAGSLPLLPFWASPSLSTVATTTCDTNLEVEDRGECQ